jgi:hypothetical protein
MNKLTRLAVAIVALGMLGTLSASTIRFDELGVTPQKSLDGVVYGGVLFNFSPLYAAFYNGSIGGGTIELLDPVVEGDTNGVLTLQFDTPISQLDFDVALLTLADIPATNPGPAYHVNLWNGATSVLSDDQAAPAQLFYAESHFTYTGSAVDRADISFYNRQDPFGAPGENVTRFAMDNLSFNAVAPPPESVSTPDPRNAVLFGSGLVALGLVRRRTMLP